jgi:uncharacterized protein (DUF697 family)
MIFANQLGHHTQFQRLLNSKQKQTLNNIRQERLTQYIIGTLLGIIISASILIFIPMKNTTAKSCFGASILLFIQYVYYRLTPKTHGLMVQHLDNPEQIQKWTDIYFWMKNLYLSGMIFGLLAYLFFVKFVICECV